MDSGKDDKESITTLFGMDKKMLKNEYIKCNELYKKILPFLCIYIFTYGIYLDRKMRGDVFFGESMLVGVWLYRH